MTFSIESMQFTILPTCVIDLFSLFDNTLLHIFIIIDITIFQL